MLHLLIAAFLTLHFVFVYFPLNPYTTHTHCVVAHVIYDFISNDRSEEGGEHRDVSEDVIAKYVLGVTMQKYRVLDAEYDEAKIWAKWSASTAAVAAACVICSKTGKMQVCGGCKQRNYEVARVK
jgi:hypothetical protein